MDKTMIVGIRKVDTGGIEIYYEVDKTCFSRNRNKLRPATTRTYQHTVVIPKEMIPLLQEAIDNTKY